jgi:hypothetical protein
MTASGSNSTAPIPTDGLHHLIPFSPSSSLTVLVDLILGFVIHTRNDKGSTPLDLCPNGAITLTNSCHLLLLSADLVERRHGATEIDGDHDVCIHPGMVGNLEATLDWVRAKGS